MGRAYGSTHFYLMKNIDKINLREELADIINNYGHWMVIRQALPNMVCPCINPSIGEPSSQCNLCLGSGKAYIDTFIKGRRSRPIGIAQNIGGENRAFIGYQNSPDHIFYVEHTVKPTVDDYILEIALDPDDLEPRLS